jgi:hypothetical protein
MLYNITLLLGFCFYWKFNQTTLSGSSHIDKVVDVIPSIQALSIISYQHQIKKNVHLLKLN